MFDDRTYQAEGVIEGTIGGQDYHLTLGLNSDPTRFYLRLALAVAVGLAVGALLKGA